MKSIQSRLKALEEERLPNDVQDITDDQICRFLAKELGEEYPSAKARSAKARSAKDPEEAQRITEDETMRWIERVLSDLGVSRVISFNGFQGVHCHDGDESIR